VCSWLGRSSLEAAVAHRRDRAVRVTARPSRLACSPAGISLARRRHYAAVVRSHGGRGARSEVTSRALRYVG
jgi:hypothetical protein